MRWKKPSPNSLPPETLQMPVPQYANTSFPRRWVLALVSDGCVFPRRVQKIFFECGTLAVSNNSKKRYTASPSAKSVKLHREPRTAGRVVWRSNHFLADTLRPLRNYICTRGASPKMLAKPCNIPFAPPNNVGRASCPVSHLFHR